MKEERAVITFRCPQEIKDKLQEFADEERRTLSDFLNLEMEVLIGEKEREKRMEEFEKQERGEEEVEKITKEERENDRSYLYGRLILVYETLEMYLRNNLVNGDIIVGKNYSDFTREPITTLKNIKDQFARMVKEHQYLKINNGAVYDLLTNLADDLENKINTLYPDNNDELSATYLYGYYRQNRDFREIEIGNSYYMEQKYLKKRQ